jgi:hypothetical protein
VAHVSVAALAGADDVGADGDARGRRIVDAKEDDDAGLVGDVEEEGLEVGVWRVEEDWLRAGVADRRCAREGNAQEVGDGEALEEGGCEGELGVSEEVVFEGGGLFGWREEGEGAGGLLRVLLALGCEV